MRTATPFLLAFTAVTALALPAQAQNMSAYDWTRMLNAAPPKPAAMSVGGGGAEAASAPSASMPSAQDITRRLNAMPPRGGAAPAVPEVTVAPAVPAVPVAQTPAVTPPSAPPAQSLSAQELTRILNGAPARKPEAVEPARPTLPAVPISPAETPVVRRQVAREVQAATSPDSLGREAIQALPFRIDLQGAQISERPAGAGAKVYSVKAGGETLLMIYAGPRSQYPIYDGQKATVGDRESIVVLQDRQRIAIEHLFRREGAEPADIHVWLMAMDGPRANLAEMIGQSVDPR